LLFSILNHQGVTSVSRKYCYKTRRNSDLSDFAIGVADVYILGRGAASLGNVRDVSRQHSGLISWNIFTFKDETTTLSYNVRNQLSNDAAALPSGTATLRRTTNFHVWKFKEP